MIDFSIEQLDILRKFDMHVHYGDATRPDLLHAAGIAEAKMLVVAIDGKEAINTLVRHAVATYPDLHVVARAVDRNHVYDLWGGHGCRDIIRETYDASLRMSRSAFEALGHDQADADRMVAAFDRIDRRVMLDAAEAYDPTIPPAHENDAYLARLREMRDDWEEQLRGDMRPASSASGGE